MRELTPEQQADIDRRVQERNRWLDRLERLDLPLTGDEWPRLRLQLREECANHDKDMPLYRFARSCPHDVPLDDWDYTDDLHVRGEDGELLCLAEVVGHACICQDGYCSQFAVAQNARDDLWWWAGRRAEEARHG